MIILLVILTVIAVAGTFVTTAIRKGLDPSDSYASRARKTVGTVRTALILSLIHI